MEQLLEVGTLCAVKSLAPKRKHAIEKQKPELFDLLNPFEEPQFSR